ncbi:MAG: hypothetical protein WC712_01890 [Candidatus Brocadiia bacterium]
MNPRVPTRLDRYPAKMVSHLAECLIDRYAAGCENLLDPFCGSGAILSAGSHRGVPVTGYDVNPYAVLLSSVKLEGFCPEEAERLRQDLTQIASTESRSLPIAWNAKDYWFTPATLAKYERLRSAARDLNLIGTRAGRAVLLSLALSVRLCSRADQRSPKPFISKRAIRERGGKHFDPFLQVGRLLKELSTLYGREEEPAKSTRVFCVDLTTQHAPTCQQGYSHVITSPPYLNAQDYFRNFKLELNILEGVMPFEVNNLRNRFIGTERGKLMADTPLSEVDEHRRLVPGLKELAASSPRHAAVAHRYFHDMGRAIKTMSVIVRTNGTCVIVCGDNLVGGLHIKTWEALNSLMERNGFAQFDSFSDTIQNRMVPPTRKGHKGLIKEEHVTAFRRL